MISTARVSKANGSTLSNSYTYTFTHLITFCFSCISLLSLVSFPPSLIVAHSLHLPLPPLSLACPHFPSPSSPSNPRLRADDEFAAKEQQRALRKMQDDGSGVKPAYCDSRYYKILAGGNGQGGVGCGGQ